MMYYDYRCSIVARFTSFPSATSPVEIFLTLGRIYMSSNEGRRKPVVTVKPRLLSLHDAALYLGMSEAKLQRLVKANKIPVVRFGEEYSSWSFDLPDLDRAIEANKKTLAG